MKRPHVCDALETWFGCGESHICIWFAKRSITGQKSFSSPLLIETRNKKQTENLPQPSRIMLLKCHPVWGGTTKMWDASTQDYAGQIDCGANQLVFSSQSCIYFLTAFCFWLDLPRILVWFCRQYNSWSCKISHFLLFLFCCCCKCLFCSILLGWKMPFLFSSLS